MENAGELPSVELEFIGRDFRRPPMVDLLFDLTLRNTRGEARWFLLTSTFSSSSLLETRTVNAAEVFELAGQGRVVVVDFLGAARCRALLLPPRAQVKLRRFPILLFEEDHVDSVEVEVIIADRLEVDGEPAQRWFAANALSDVQADVSNESSKRISSRNTPGLEEVPLTVAEEQRFKLTVPLDQNTTSL